jgi:hypothetical protein
LITSIVPAPAVPTIYLNGKFTAQHITGAQRVALSLVLALDQLPAQQSAGVRMVLACPANGRPPALKHIEVRRSGRPGMALSAWEQLWLPLVARGALLVNLSGSAPLIKGRQFCMIHDAAVIGGMPPRSPRGGGRSLKAGVS